MGDSVMGELNKLAMRIPYGPLKKKKKKKINA